jgi:16S rRNA (cytidine1402-2'-O)-methyltransferase
VFRGPPDVQGNFVRDTQYFNYTGGWRYTACLAGKLYLVATPIGNLEDITLRALRVLREEVALIACEDTRQTQKLLHHFEIRKPLIAYHEHNETSRAAEIVERLQREESVALVTDAGTPLVSDPGYRVVAAAVEAGITVIPIPGASAVLAALAASGLPTNEFRFAGFLPPKQLARRKTLEELSAETGTLVLYESPHRILDTLTDIQEVMGNRPIVLARELTKLHEEFLRGKAGEIRDQLQARTSVKGEITLVIGRAEELAEMPGDPVAAVAELQNAGVERMEAIKSVAKRLGLPKREVYRLAMEQGSSSPDKRRG